jgi:hypothetical protein
MIAERADEDCRKFLESGNHSLNDYINDVLSNDLIVSGSFDNGIAAFTGTGDADRPAGTAAIVVNEGSAFMNGAYTVNGTIQGGTTEAQVFMLLHELGHALESRGFLPDRDDPENGKKNDG